LFGGCGRRLGRLLGLFVERGAKVVAHRVHTGDVVSRCEVERADLLYL
jgi:hypothetical protein